MENKNEKSLVTSDCLEEPIRESVIICCEEKKVVQINPFTDEDALGFSTISYLQIFNKVVIEGLGFTLDPRVTNLYKQHRTLHQ